MRCVRDGVRCENVWITESGGTTGISLSRSDSSGWRTCDSRDSEGFVMNASADKDQKKMLEPSSVKACRSAGIIDQDAGEGSTRLEYTVVLVKKFLYPMSKSASTPPSLMR